MVDLGIREEAPHGYSAAIIGLMRDHKVTFYDAAYHALAIRHRGTMLTADRAYVKKTARARARHAAERLASVRLKPDTTY